MRPMRNDGEDVEVEPRRVGASIWQQRAPHLHCEHCGSFGVAQLLGEADTATLSSDVDFFFQKF